MSTISMGRTCVFVLLAVCVMWTFGAILSCDQCGSDCTPSCGTRQFRACCYNKQQMKKRVPDHGPKLWVGGPPSETGYLQLVYDA